MKMKLLKLSFVFLIALCFVIPGKTNADTIVLKNGSKIEVDRAWEEGGFIKAKSRKGTIGFAKENVGAVIHEKDDQNDSFEFDIWRAGITIDKAFKIAEFNKDSLVNQYLFDSPVWNQPYQRY